MNETSGHGGYRTSRCHVQTCPRGPRWLYIHEYNQEEGYVRRWACDLHVPGPEHPGRADAKPLDPARFPDVKIPVGVGWPTSASDDLGASGGSE